MREQGDEQSAIEHYTQALILQPGFEGAVKVLEDIAEAE